MNPPVLSYEERLRLRITRFIDWLFCAFLSIFLVGFGIFWFAFPGDNHGLGLGVLAILLACDVTFVLSAQATRRVQQSFWPVAGTLGATNLTITTFMAFWAASGNGFDAITLAQLVSLTLAIVLAAALGTPRLVVISTLSVNLFAIILVLLTAHPHLSGTKLLFFLLIMVMQQWTTLGLSLVILRFYRLVLRDNDIAYRRDALKNQFIRTINHEIRNPLHAMQFALVPLQAQRAALTPEGQSALDLLARQHQRLMGMVETILQIKPGTIQTMKMTVVSLDDVIAEAVELVHTTTHQWQMQVNPYVQVIGDQNVLLQVFVNLLSNAVKYSPDGGTITIRVRPQGAWVITEISDQGLGIPPDQIPLLFNSFVRLERDLRSSIPGNGLGLYLARQFIEAMGGTITVQSTGIPGEGTTLNITLRDAATMIETVLLLTPEGDERH